jgi:hypothetical protein
MTTSPATGVEGVGRRGSKRVIRRISDAARLCHGRFGATLGRGELEAIRNPQSSTAAPIVPPVR